MKKEGKLPRTVITITVFEDGSLDVQPTGDRLTNLEWIGVLAAALLGTTTYTHGYNAAQPPAPLAEEGERCERYSIYR